MAVNNVANSPSTAAGDGTANTAKVIEGLNGTYQDFLKLLTTQLNNQDPTAPMDVNQMTQQIATLSQVEQQISTNTLLKQLVTLVDASQFNNAVSYIGRMVDASGNQGVLTSGGATFVYELPAAAKSAAVTITNESGQVVFTGSGTTLAGRNQVVWDGTNNSTGNKMPNGTYKFKVEAKDDQGKAIDVTTLTTGMVTAVDTDNGTTTLTVGNMAVPLNTVRTVYNPGTVPGA